MLLTNLKFIFALFQMKSNAIAGEEALANIALDLTGIITGVEKGLVVITQNR